MQTPPDTLKHYNLPGHAHLLTFSCYHRQPFFSNGSFCGLMCEILTGARNTAQFDLWGYVIMPEHVHLLIRPQADEYRMDAILQAVKQPFARRAIALLRRIHSVELEKLETGQRKVPFRFWQAGGGHDRNLYTPNLIATELDYIHKNPIRRGLVNNPTDWPWSSASAWMLNVQGPVPIDKESFPMQK